MTCAIRFYVILGAMLMALALDPASAGDAAPASMADSPVVLSPAEAQAVTTFQTRLQEYFALHRKLEASLPALPDQATPEQVDKDQRAFSALVGAARATAKPSEFFTPEMEALVRRVLAAAFAGPEGKSMRAAIMDENPGIPNLKVNDRYPDSIPLSTMPFEVLQTLPTLEEDLEYRFVGERLALMDAHAHIILDFTADVLP